MLGAAAPIHPLLSEHPKMLEDLCCSSVNSTLQRFLEGLLESYSATAEEHSPKKTVLLAAAATELLQIHALLSEHPEMISMLLICQFNAAEVLGGSPGVILCHCRGAQPQEDCTAGSSRYRAAASSCAVVRACCGARLC